MKSAGKARSNGLYRHIRTSKEIIRNLLNDYIKSKDYYWGYDTVFGICLHICVLSNNGELILPYSL